MSAEALRSPAGKFLGLAVLTLILVEALKTLYVVESGRGDIHIFECIENDGRPIFMGVYCFEHWTYRMFKAANDN